MENADIQVTSHGRSVAHPYAVSMRIESRSHFDIRRNDFDGDLPMVLDLGAKIVSPLLINGSDELKDAVLIEGSQIRIKPTAIRRKQYLSVNVLTDGAPKLTTKNEPFQVRLRERLIHYLRWAALLAAVAVFLFILWLFAPVPTGRLGTVLANVFSILLLLGVTGLLAVGALWPGAVKDVRAGRRFATGTSPARGRSGPSKK